MLVAQKKQKENIAEYILYMFQVEDVIRAYKFDLDKLMDTYVKPHIPNSSFLPAYRKWYNDLIQNMLGQRIEKVGHLMELKEIIRFQTVVSIQLLIF